MMAKMRGLPANGLPPMAIGTSNLALVDLRSEESQGMFKEGEGDHAFAPFRPYVVEFQDDYVPFPAAHAGCIAEVIQEVTEVPSLKWPVGRHA